MTVRIKICGITRKEDALAAVEAGADALGFVFHPASPRYIPPGRAGGIVACLPPLTATVGVFVDASADAIESARRESGIGVVQLHGDESPEFCARVPGRTVKAFRIRGPGDVGQARRWATSAWLFDSHAEGVRGGSGRSFDWSWTGSLPSLRPVFVAGGLGPENVARCVCRTRPYAVDVSSGVERAPGVKDAGLMRLFVERAREAAVSLAGPGMQTRPKDAGHLG